MENIPIMRNQVYIHTNNMFLRRDHENSDNKRLSRVWHAKHRSREGDVSWSLALVGDCKRNTERHSEAMHRMGQI